MRTALAENALAASRPRRAEHEYLEGHSDYLRPEFLAHFAGRTFGSIFELGACDGQDSVALQERLGGQVHAFECSPYAQELCRRRFAGRPGLTLVPFAAWNANGRIPFYPVVETLVGQRPTPTRIGASSCFEAGADYSETYVQSRIEVEAVRVDDFRRREGLGPVDLVCLDLQGAALEALEGMPETLAGCAFVLAELETRPIYRGQKLLPEVEGYLEGFGFQRIAAVPRDAFFGDFLFARQARGV